MCSAGARESGGQGGAIDPAVRPGGAALGFDQGREADGREIVGRPCLPALRELAVAGEPVIERRIGGGGRFVGFRLKVDCRRRARLGRRETAVEAEAAGEPGGVEKGQVNCSLLIGAAP